MVEYLVGDKMIALITGASNGIGKDFAKELSKRGYDLILVARSKDKLEELKKELKTHIEIEIMDLSIKENVYKLYEKYQGKIDLLINNAGFGAFGKFSETTLENELNMIDLNITAYHMRQIYRIVFFSKSHFYSFTTPPVSLQTFPYSHIERSSSGNIVP